MHSEHKDQTVAQKRLQTRENSKTVTLKSGRSHLKEMVVYKRF